jgi:hypothetical protein
MTQKVRFRGSAALCEIASVIGLNAHKVGRRMSMIEFWAAERREKTRTGRRPPGRTSPPSRLARPRRRAQARYYSSAPPPEGSGAACVRERSGLRRR